MTLIWLIHVKMSDHETSSSILICNSKLTQTTFKTIDFIRYCNHNGFKQKDESTVLLYILIICILMYGIIIMVSFVIGKCLSGRNSDIQNSELEAKFEIEEISLSNETQSRHFNICFVSEV